MAYKKFTPEEIAELASRFDAIATTLYKMQGELTAAKIKQYEMQAGTTAHLLGLIEAWLSPVRAKFFDIDLPKLKKSRGRTAASSLRDELEGKKPSKSEGK